MSDERAITCAQFEAEVDELAVGTTAEPARSVLLAHASTCATCRSLLDDASGISDRLLHFAPELEPPIGFEQRAVARMTLESPPGTARRPWMLRGVATAVLVVALGAGLAVGRASTDPTGTPGDVASGAIVTTSGDRIGVAELDARSPRVVLTMDDEQSWDGEWTCQLLDDGRWIDVGSWTADDVTGGVWAAGVAPSMSDATRMRILGNSGTVIATAALDA